MDQHIYAVGFHRYVLENFTGDSLYGLKEHEVDGFDAPSEVGKKQNIAYPLYGPQPDMLIVFSGLVPMVQ